MLKCGEDATLANVLGAHAKWRATGGQDGARAKLVEELVVDCRFTDQDFSFVDFGELDFSRRSLENSNLSYADLSKCRWLTEDKLSGTNLRGATLPAGFKEFGPVGQIAEASKNANTMLVTFLAAVLVTILTVFQATDTALFVNSSGAKLPLLQIELPMASFYMLTPFILFALYVHLNINIIRLYELIRSLPEVFPDGFPVYAKIYPWFFLGLLFVFRAPQYYTRPAFYRLQGLISLIALLIAFPVFLIVIFVRYLAIQNWSGIAILALASSVTVYFSARFLLSAWSVFTRSIINAAPSRYRALLDPNHALAFTLTWIGSLVLIHCLAGWVAISSSPPTTGKVDFDSGIPRLLAAVGASPFANLTGAELSKRPDGWSPDTPADALLAKIPRVSLSGVRLRHAAAKGVFGANVDLMDADLTGAHFEFSEFQNATLTGVTAANTIFFGANFFKAIFKQSKLTMCSFREAKLGKANFDNTEIKQCDFDRANLARAQFSLAHLENATFRFANLDAVDFNSAIIVNGDFHSAEGAGAKFRTAKITKTTFAQAKLSDADFTSAVFTEVNLSGADLSNAKVDAAQLANACGDKDTKIPKNLVGALKLCS